MDFELAQKIANLLIGTPRSIESALEQLDLEGEFCVDEVEEAVVEHCNIERCSECDWWCEAGELVDANCEEVPCSSCRDPEED